MERSSALTERLLALGDVAKVGSWELDLRTGDTVWSEGMFRVLGLDPDAAVRDEEAVLAVVHPEDRPRIAGLLEALTEAPASVPDEGLMEEFRVIRADGVTRVLSAFGRVERGAGGRPARWIGVVQDVTDEQLTRRELLAHYALTQALLDWESLEEGAMALLARVGSALDYPLGTLWLLDPGIEALACRAFWSAEDVDAEHFEWAKRSRTFKPGEGKPGVAWESREPVLTPDAATDPVFQPRDAAVLRGVASALAFPAVGPDGPLAVLSFYSFEHCLPSPTLVRTLKSLGAELGRFLHARRVELGPRPLSGRETEVLRLAAHGHSGPEIAEILYVSSSTVKTHFENIYEKLGVNDRAAAVAQAIRIGLID